MVRSFFHFRLNWDGARVHFGWGISAWRIFQGQNTYGRPYHVIALPFQLVIAVSLLNPSSTADRYLLSRPCTGKSTKCYTQRPRSYIIGSGRFHQLRVPAHMSCDNCGSQLEVHRLSIRTPRVVCDRKRSARIP